MISVILPVYNAEKFLKEAIQSVLDQTFGSFELIILNDGSTDESEKIVNSFVDPRIRYIKHANNGLIYTLNLGLELAKFEIVARMDADDICVPERFSLQYAYLKEHNNIGAVGGQTQLIGSTGVSVGNGIYPITSLDCRSVARFGAPLAHPAVMFRKSLVISCGGYREAFKHAEDYDLWLRILERSEIANLDCILLKYRLHDVSVSKVHADQQQVSTIAAKVSAKLRRVGEPDFEYGKSISFADILNKIGQRPEFSEEYIAAEFYGLGHRQKDILSFQKTILTLARLAKVNDLGVCYVQGLIVLSKAAQDLKWRLICWGNLMLALIIFPKESLAKVLSIFKNRLYLGF